MEIPGPRMEGRSEKRSMVQWVTGPEITGQSAST